MADRRRRRRQNSNDSVVESEDEGVGDEDTDGRPIPASSRTAGRDYYQVRDNKDGNKILQDCRFRLWQQLPPAMLEKERLA